MTGNHLDDLQLSSLLDGEASESEVLHAQGCPDCTLRLSGLRDAARLVGSPVAAPGELALEAAVAAALGEADAQTTARRRRWTATQTAGRLAAAAVLVLVVLIGVRAFGEGGGHPASTSKSASHTGTGLPQGAASGTNGASAGASAGGSVEFGPVDSLAGLVAALRSQLARTNTQPVNEGRSLPAAAGASPVSACDPRARRLVANAPADTSFQSALTFRGTPTVAYVFAVGGHDVVVVLRASDCATIAETTF
jgi:hypothetical protein